MGRIIAVLAFDGMEEMDFTGPWEVLGAALDDHPQDRILSVAESRDPVRCEKGLRLLPDVTFDEVPKVDVLVVPGGSGARREIGNPATVAWLKQVAPGCAWITSVCTGSFLLVGAGLAEGRRVTTHHRFIRMLREDFGGNVAEGMRFLREGNLVTAAGVMSGIEMSLWLVGQLYGEAAERDVRDYIAYDHPPREG